MGTSLNVNTTNSIIKYEFLPPLKKKKRKILDHEKQDSQESYFKRGKPLPNSITLISLLITNPFK